MKRERFETLLGIATDHALAVARSMVVEELSSEVRYQPLSERGVPVGLGLKKMDLIDQLWRQGEIPEWIDLSVMSVVEATTIIRVEWAERLVEDEFQCVYAKRGQGPFGIKSPVLPPNWISVEVSGRFTLSRRKDM
jgi:hypothetical protein